ncbi:MAG: lipid A-modifier LpxR family protein [Saprospiraceae bacterium]
MHKIILKTILGLLIILINIGSLKSQLIFKYSDYFRSLKSDYKINYIVGQDESTGAFHVYGLKLIPSITKFELASDQDVFALKYFKSDRNYTMGVALNWHGDGTAKNYLFGLPFLLKYIDNLYGPKLYNKFSISYNFSFGFAAFTPDSIGLQDPILNDRPYASNLFFRAGRTYHNSSKISFRTDFSLGIIGTGIAEFVQTAIHSGQRIHNSNARPNPLGWKYQISNGNTLSLQYNVLQSYQLWSKTLKVKNSENNSDIEEIKKYLKKIDNPGLNYNFSWTNGMGIGIYNYIKTGISMKFGAYRNSEGEILNSLQNNNPILIVEASETDIPLDTFNKLLAKPMPNCKVHRFEIFIYSEPEIKYWMYNALLQGWVKTNDAHTFDSHKWFSYQNVSPFVFTYSLGLGIIFNRTILKFSFMGRSPEFKTDIFRWHHWGQASIGYTLN